MLKTKECIFSSEKCSKFVYFMQIRCMLKKFKGIFKTLEKCFFTAVKLTKNVNPDKYKHSGYNIRFYSRSKLSWPDESEQTLLSLESIKVLL